VVGKTAATAAVSNAWIVRYKHGTAVNKQTSIGTEGVSGYTRDRENHC